MENSLNIFISDILPIMIGGVISLYLMIFAHEAGHYLFGKLTGYTFSSFTFLGRTLYRQDGQLKIKKYALKGTGGQCLMNPPEYSENFPYKLYNFGGALVNLLMAIFANFLLFAIEGPYTLRIVLMLFFVLNGLGALQNGLPAIIGGIPNDGKNVLFASKDGDAKKAFHQQLYIAAFFSDHENFTDLPYEEAKVDPDADLSNYLTGNGKMFEASWLIEAGRADEGIRYMIGLEDHILQYPGYYRANFINELAYTYIQYDYESSFIEHFLEKKHQSYSKKMMLQNYDLAQAAYHFSKGEEELGKAHLEKAKKIIGMIPQIGLQKQAENQIERLEEKFLAQTTEEKEGLADESSAIQK